MAFKPFLHVPVFFNQIALEFGQAAFKVPSFFGMACHISIMPGDEIFDLDFNFSLVGIFIGLGDLDFQIALELRFLCFMAFKPFLHVPVFLDWIRSIGLSIGKGTEQEVCEQ